MQRISPRLCKGRGSKNSNEIKWKLKCTECHNSSARKELLWTSKGYADTKNKPVWRCLFLPDNTEKQEEVVGEEVGEWIQPSSPMLAELWRMCEHIHMTLTVVTRSDLSTHVFLAPQLRVFLCLNSIWVICLFVFRLLFPTAVHWAPTWRTLFHCDRPFWVDGLNLGVHRIPQREIFDPLVQ